MKKIITLSFICLNISMLSLIQAATVVVTQVEAIGSGTEQEYNLTNLGSSDWQIFTGDTVAPTDEMSGGSGIGALTYDGGVGGTLLTQTASGKSPGYTWTNGINTASQTNGQEDTLATVSDELNIGQTFTLTVDATNTASELYFWVMGENVNLDITGTLSGTGTTNTLAAGAGGNSPFFGLFKIDFTADTVSDTLTVDIERTGSQGGSNFRHGIQAAALTVIPEPSSLVLVGIALAGGMLVWRR